MNFEWSNYKILESCVLLRTPGYSIANKIKLTGEGISRAELNKESEFCIDCTRVESHGSNSNQPKIFFTNLLNEPDETLISIAQISKDLFKCNYIVEKAGKLFFF